MKNRSFFTGLISAALFLIVALTMAVLLSGCTCEGREQNEAEPLQSTTVQLPQPSTRQTSQPATQKTSQPATEKKTAPEGEDKTENRKVEIHSSIDDTGKAVEEQMTESGGDASRDPGLWYEDYIGEQNEQYEQPDLVIQDDGRDAGQTSAPEPTVHQHNWIPVYSYVHHDAVTEEVWVIDSPAWTGPAVYETHDVCVSCGAYLDQMSYEEMTAHIRQEILAGGSGQSEIRNILIKEEEYHQETGHYEIQIISEAWDEQVVDHYVCTGCGSIS